MGMANFYFKKDGFPTIYHAATSLIEHMLNQEEHKHLISYYKRYLKILNRMIPANEPPIPRIAIESYECETYLEEKSDGYYVDSDDHYLWLDFEFCVDGYTEDKCYNNPHSGFVDLEETYRPAIKLIPIDLSSPLPYQYYPPNSRNEDVSVIMYADSEICKRAIKFLQDHAIEYRYVYLSELPRELSMEFTQKFANTYKRYAEYPTVLLRDQVLFGFNPIRWENAFGRKNKDY